MCLGEPLSTSYQTHRACCLRCRRGYAAKPTHERQLSGAGYSKRRSMASASTSTSSMATAAARKETQSTTWLEVRQPVEQTRTVPSTSQTFVEHRTKKPEQGKMKMHRAPRKPSSKKRGCRQSPHVGSKATAYHQHSWRSSANFAPTPARHWEAILSSATCAQRVTLRLKEPTRHFKQWLSTRSTAGSHCRFAVKNGSDPCATCGRSRSERCVTSRSSSTPSKESPDHCRKHGSGDGRKEADVRNPTKTTTQKYKTQKTKRKKRNGVK